MVATGSEISQELDDWDVVCRFLPEGWEQQARELGAIKRARGVADAQALLRILLIHVAGGCSLAETAARARHRGLGRLNGSAVYKRLRGAEQWLRWLAERMREQSGMAVPATERRVRATDASAVCEPGSTGTDWRIHYAIDLRNLQCDFFELTGLHGGETWRRFPVAAGDILLGDRGYANPNGVHHVVEAGGDLAVRLNRKALPLWDEPGERLDPLAPARTLTGQRSGEWPAWVHLPSGARAAGRLIVVRKSRQAAARDLKRARQIASRKQYVLSEDSIEALRYFFLWTTLPPAWSCARVLNLYRCRWQIELAFKRMKSIMGLGHLPKKDPESCRAWLHGKLFTSLLVERLLGAAKTISPWGYDLAESPQPVA